MGISLGAARRSPLADGRVRNTDTSTPPVIGSDGIYSETWSSLLAATIMWPRWSAHLMNRE